MGNRRLKLVHKNKEIGGGGGTEGKEENWPRQKKSIPGLQAVTLIG